MILPLKYSYAAGSLKAAISRLSSPLGRVAADRVCLRLLLAAKTQVLRLPKVA
jgi:hypothetical protein